MRLQGIATIVLAACASCQQASTTTISEPNVEPLPICARGLVTVTPFDDHGTTSFHVSAHAATPAYDAGVRFQSDINGDGKDDLALVMIGSCGSLYECMIGVYVYCAPDHYAEVLAPQYFYHLEVAPGAPGQWATLTVTDRIDKHELAEPYTLEFDGTQYFRHY
jgi:hypothetical protein